MSRPNQNPILFVDFHGVISKQLYWHSLREVDHPLHYAYEKAHEFLFQTHKEVSLDWMLGEYTSEEVHRILESEVKIPFDTLFPIFENDCRNADISSKILAEISILRDHLVTILVTDNADCFTRFTLDSHPELATPFDRIDCSSLTKRFKKTQNGQYFADTAVEYGSDISKCYLIDDSESNCEAMRNLGGNTYNVSEEDLVISVLRSISDDF